MYVFTNLAALTEAAIERSLLHCRPVFRRLAFALVGLALLWATEAKAAQLLQYLQVPASGNFTSPTTYNLPNYGNVQVDLFGTNATFFDQINGYNQGAGPYNWGTDTQRFGILNTSSGILNYTLKFTFLSGQPNHSDLAVVVVGLARGTTASITQPGSLVGEYTFPQSGFYPGGPSSTTLLNSQVFSSLNDRDPLNTGWALYQPTGNFSTIALNVSQIPGDGIGFTLGYAVPEPATIGLLGIGTASLVIVAVRKRRKTARERRS